jgi:hypothetical protein
MFRIFHVLVTVLGIIVCPFACAGHTDELNASETAELRPGRACPCCAHDERLRGEQPPSNGQQGRGSRSDCNCTCLCKGALKRDQGARVGIPIDVLNVPFVLPVVFDKTSHMEAATSWLVGGPPPSCPAGRAARIIHQSLLC